MPWFAAHLLMVFEPITPLADESEDEFHLWENVVLFSGATSAEAWAKAIARGEAEERDGEGSELRVDGRPARMVFGGIRVLVECDGSGDGGALREGDEITSTQMMVKGRGALGRLIGGSDVDVWLKEAIRDPNEPL